MEYSMVSPEAIEGASGDEQTPSSPPVAPPSPAAYGASQSATGYVPPFAPLMGGAAGTPPMYAVGQPGNLTDRFVAWFIDAAIVGVASRIITVVLAFISHSWLLTGFISSVVTTALYFGYVTYLESSRGQTLGKQVMKLKVVGPDHASNPTLEQAARRNAFTTVGVVGVVPIIGSVLRLLAQATVMILIAVNINSDPQRQHWFDKFAGGTQVLKIG